MKINKKVVLTILACCLICGCTKTQNNNIADHQVGPDKILGQYRENNTYKTAFFILKNPSVNITDNIKTVDLYCREGNCLPGYFYWQKVADPYEDVNLGKVPATFKENKLWPIE